MPPTLRFHLDENVDPAVAGGSSPRHRCDHVGRGELLTASDELQLAAARLGGRVVVTHDADFLRLHGRGVHHAGIVFIPKGLRTVGEAVRGLVILAECLTAAEMADHLEFL